MAYKSILTVVTHATPVAAQIDAAVDLARREDAHLDVLCLGIDRTQTGYYYVGAAPMAPVLLQETLDQARDEARAAEAAVRQQLAPEDIRWAIDTGIVQAGLVGERVGLLARFSDLVVLVKPSGKAHEIDAEGIIESALFDGHAPVLLLPGEKPAGSWGKRVVVAWNQSNEALRAVRAALPILKAAAVVDVAVVDPPAHGPERSDPGGMLSQYLARHGVKAEVSVHARTLPRVAEVLCRHAEDIGADMVVMGAYGHSRFREAILGGATRHMFEIARIPIFTAH
jgi:nucleotide-binding universal stress UspA family protein